MESAFTPCGIADNSRLRSQDAWFSFPLLLGMIDWCSVEVLVDPVLHFRKPYVGPTGFYNKAPNPNEQRWSPWVHP